MGVGGVVDVVDEDLFVVLCRGLESGDLLGREVWILLKIVLLMIFFLRRFLSFWILVSCCLCWDLLCG